MATIRVTPEQMRSSAQRVHGQTNDWRTAISRINVLVADMAAMWDGLGNDSFMNVFREDQPRFDQLLVMMNEYYTAIQTAAQAYDAGEQEVSNIVSRR